MQELLLGIPAAAGVFGERLVSSTYYAFRRPFWRREVQNAEEGNASLFDRFIDLGPVEQAERQLENIRFMAGVPEQIATARLTYLKGLAALGAFGFAALKFRERNYYEAFQSVSIGLPFLTGAIFDGIKAREDLSLELVLNRELPAWEVFKKLLFG